MNYAVVAFAVVIIISSIQWFVDGRHNFKGPSFDEDAFLVTGVEEAEIAKQQNQNTASKIDKGDAEP